MARLDRIVLINAAGFDYLDFPVGGHGQVIGVNGHGKSTLLRTVLFFYLCTNEKAPYALFETKSDFVSYYLGDPPSYLIYEVARGNGQPSYHIAVTRPSGRIQFQFVDAPFLKDYYVNGSFVQTIDKVMQKLRDARCAHESVGSYEEVSRRLYGIAPSPYAVFRPAPRSSGQVSILPRIISGIFTVSQLDADKLKAALTCGVREDSLNTEFDLLALKGQLENFRRVNRAVKTFLRYEDDALQLVDVAEQFELAKTERKRAIDDLVRMAKRLPERAGEIQKGLADLASERTQASEQYDKEKTDLQDVIKKLGEALAVLKAKIQRGEETQKDYASKQIDSKKVELETLPRLHEEKRQGDEEYAALTGKFDDENQRKDRMLGNVQQSWTELSRQFEQARAEAERMLVLKLEEVSVERTNAFAAVDDEHQRAKASFNVRQAGLDFSRGKLNEELKALADLEEPDELKKCRKTFEEQRNKLRAESTRLQTIRAEIPLQKEQRERAREKIDQAAEAERSLWQGKVNEGKTKRDLAATELEKFDESLARFYQTQSPNTWPSAAKTLSRDVLFHAADQLQAQASKVGRESVWGVELSTELLPSSPDSYDRNGLEKRLQELRDTLAGDADQLTAVQQRYVAAVDAFERQAVEAQSTLQSKIDSCSELCRVLSIDVEQLENRMITLESQYDAHKRDWRSKLEARDKELRNDERLFRTEQTNSEKQFLARKQTLDSDFNLRKTQLSKERDARLAVVSEQAQAADRKRDTDRERIEEAFRDALTKQGASEGLIRKAKDRVDKQGATINRIMGFAKEVNEYEALKREFIDPLDSLRSRWRTTKESLDSETERLRNLESRHGNVMNVFKTRQAELDGYASELKTDEDAVTRFRADRRFLLEWGLFDDDKVEPAHFYTAGAAKELAELAVSNHETRVEIETRGNKDARAFLNRFDAETLDRKVLGFSPIHEHFNWYLFVGAELRPFVNGRGINGMKQIQTQEFEQLIRNVCAKNADFQEGIRQVRQTAALVQSNLEHNNFVDVLDSIELKVERLDNRLAEILAELEAFAGLTFTADRDLFGKRADRDQIDKAIETFARLVREIENYREKSLRLTDYFDFFIRVHENGNDMGWRKSLDHIGSTGTDYLVKMLIYLSLIEVYRERAIDARSGSTVHCVLDETGVLAPKYVRRILEYAKERGIILITAGHSQQTIGFENWVRVRKRGQRFGGQTVLRKVLKCD